ncbi:MAG TPA: T9SS type A sorting domain-containing protein, partial [Candidatus Cloacimonadota bacterium]|nr:T9SS type A sorting domain-containing protein [Candidatus Cloacimonadota bacterium]
YLANCDVWLKSSQALTIPADPAKDVNMMIEQRIYTEWDHDFVTIDISTDQQNWSTLYSKAGQYDNWFNTHISLNDYRGQSVYFRFRLKDGLENDTNLPELTDPGWDISRICIASFTPDFLDSDSQNELKPLIALKGNYPNPFNPETRITFNISDVKVNQATIDIFNIKGQKVQTLNIGPEELRKQFIVWKNENISSGIYFYRLSVNGQSFGSKKALLLK